MKANEDQNKGKELLFSLHFFFFPFSFFLLFVLPKSPNIPPKEKEKEKK
jgi:hypothetical protein